MQQAPRFCPIELEALTKAMKEIIFIEREVEQAKIELSLKSDLNLYDLFRNFDSKGDGNITDQCLRHGLESNLSFHDFIPDDVYMFFRRFDRHGIGYLNFNALAAAILPFSREYALLVTDRPEYYCKRETDPRRFFQVDTRYELQSLFSVIFKAER